MRGIHAAVLCALLAAGCTEDECNWTCWDQSVWLENGGSQMCGGCVCGGPPDCHIPEGSSRYTCETAQWLEPGEHAPIRGWGIGMNSFWYTDQIVAGSPGELDPCPDEDPCCHDVTYPVGFRVGSIVVPLDTTDLMGHDWGCSGTNCEATCSPRPGTRVWVHVTIDPLYGLMSVTSPDETNRYLVAQVCEIRD